MERIEIRPPERYHYGAKYDRRFVSAPSPKPPHLNTPYVSQKYGVKYWISMYVEGELDYGFWVFNFWDTLVYGDGGKAKEVEFTDKEVELLQHELEVKELKESDATL